MRWVIAAVLVLAIALVVTQLLLPRVGENRVEDRLTRDGGSADVTIRAVPALRLLFDDGDKLEVRARGVRIPVRLEAASFKELDGFDQVDVELSDARVGPFEADRVVIRRGGGDDLYDFAFRGSTSAGALANFALSALPPVLRSLAEIISGRPSSQKIPIRLDADLRSNRGNARLVRGSGTVAGLPLGGISLAIASAVINRVTG